MQWKPKGSCKADSPSDTQGNSESSHMEHQENVRDSKNHPSSKRAENYKIGVLGLSETRWLQSGQLRLSSGEQLLYSGHIEEGPPPPPHPLPSHTECGPDACTGGIWGTHWLGTCQLLHHHSQVYHQEERHQAEHHPLLCSHQWWGGRDERWLLPITTSSDRQKRSKGQNHTDRRFQHQDRNGQHRLRGHYGDTWTGTDEWKQWALCRPVRPEPAGDRKQHLPTKVHPQGHMDISEPCHREPDQPHMH